MIRIRAARAMSIMVLSLKTPLRELSPGEDVEEGVGVIVVTIVMNDGMVNCVGVAMPEVAGVEGSKSTNDGNSSVGLGGAKMVV